MKEKGVKPFLFFYISYLTTQMILFANNHLKLSI